MWRSWVGWCWGRKRESGDRAQGTGDRWCRRGGTTVSPLRDLRSGADNHLCPVPCALCPWWSAPMKHERAVAYAAFATVCIDWGTTYLFIRIAVETIPPLLLTAVRYLGAGIILLLIAAARGDRLPRDRRLLREIAVVGVLLVGVGNLSVVWAEQWV